VFYEVPGVACIEEDLVSIENVTGSAFNDELRGDAGANVLAGLAGNDILEGRGGDDCLIGGAGDDTFVFGAGFGHDQVADFASGSDKLDLTALGLGAGDLMIDEIDGHTVIEIAGIDASIKLLGVTGFDAANDLLL